MSKADIGLIGLAVMGQNLVLNMDDHGYTVAVFNRTVSKVDEFINGNAKGTKIFGTHSIEELVTVLKKTAPGDAAGESRAGCGQLYRHADPSPGAGGHHY
jgi:6-phosphogluconate dehydrogenase